MKNWKYFDFINESLCLTPGLLIKNVMNVTQVIWTPLGIITM